MTQALNLLVVFADFTIIKSPNIRQPIKSITRLRPTDLCRTELNGSLSVSQVGLHVIGEIAPTGTQLPGPHQFTSLLRN